MKQYLFDVKLFASVSVVAQSLDEAKAILSSHLDCGTIALVAEGEPALYAEASADGEPDLVEVTNMESET